MSHTHSDSHLPADTASEFVVGEMPTISGYDEAQARVYRRIDCARGVWLVAHQANEADNVYFHNPRDIHSAGFGGATLRFPLIDGGEYVAKGPWKGNADKLFSDTGYDCRHKHLSFVVIGMNGEFRSRQPGHIGGSKVIKQIVHRDEKPTIGLFHRWKLILVDQPDGLYHFFSATSGGCHYGTRTVDDWWRSEIRAGHFYPSRPPAERGA